MGGLSSKLYFNAPTTIHAATEASVAQSAAVSHLSDPAGAASPVVLPLLVPISTPIEGIATHYGESYSGQLMACGGFYVSEDASITAVSLSRDAEWECGVHLEVCGQFGCLRVVRQDSCPGCDENHIDLSEAGIVRVCGEAADLCDVTIQPMRLVGSESQPSVRQEPTEVIHKLPMQ